MEVILSVYNKKITSTVHSGTQHTESCLQPKKMHWH